MNSRNFWLGFVAALAGAGVILWRRLAKEQALPSMAGPSRGLTPSTATPQEPDPLEEIQGIGPVFAQRLRAAGVKSFRQLAELPQARERAS
jgi:predicted flap endonuclease-1-like 5' DNA nuclease